MSEKSINYMARDFNTIKSELVKLSKSYYPELADSFNDASVGSWIIDLVSAVGDDLNYYIDRCYNEQNANSAYMKSSVLNIARMNNVKIPGPKAAMCEIEISLVLPKTNTDDMAMPNWEVAPRLKQGAVVSNGLVEFEILEDVDFKEQFNRDAVSNRRYSPRRDSRGIITSYLVTKTVLASAGRSRIYKKVLTSTDIKPFMEVVLPFRNIMEVEGVLFKETSNLSVQPELFEFSVNAERFRVEGETINTYKFFEVDSLTDQYVFGQEVKTPGEVKVYEDPHVFDEEYHYYKGAWMPLMQKYITEYTDNGYLKLIFGSGVGNQSLNDTGTSYAEHEMTKIVNNDLTGILPKAGWTMYVLYRDGGGQVTNIAPNSLNSLNVAEWIYPTDIDINDRRAINHSIKVTNISQGVAGVDAPSVNEIKYITRYNISAQQRCVTLKDYELRVKMMPPKYGAPFRCKAIEDNNKIILYMLGISADGYLTAALPNMMTDNIKRYLLPFKSLGDYVELRSGNIYNIKAEASVFVDKNYSKQSVIKSIIATVNNFFMVDEHKLGDDLFIGELEKEISSIDGVANLIQLKLYTLTGGNYSSTAAPVPTVSNSTVAIDGNATQTQIDLSRMNKMLVSDAQGMFEIKYIDKDIKVRVATV